MITDESTIGQSINNYLADYTETKWLIDKLIPIGTKCLLTAPPGAGKSWLILSMALSVASGNDYLGHYPINRQGAVMLVDEDSSGHSTKRRLRQLISGMGLDSGKLPIALYEHKGFSLDEEESQRELAAEVVKIKPSLLILETFDKLHGPDINENDATDVRAWFSQLDYLQRVNPEMAIVITHHTNKRGDVDTTTKIRGSGAIAASVDVGYMVSIFNRQKSTLLIQPIPKRFELPNPFKAKIFTPTDDVGLMIWEGDCDANLGLNELREYELVLDIAKDAGGMGVTVKSVTDQSERLISESAARCYLNMGTEKGVLWRGSERANRHRFFHMESKQILKAQQNF